MTTKQHLRDALRRWIGRHDELRTPEGIEAQFALVYGDLPIGVLKRTRDLWLFWYTEEFKRRDDLRPIANFPDVDRVYKSTELWPFFSLRIPDTKREDVRDIARHDRIDITNEVELLRRFGQRTVANPYELLEPSI